MVFGKVANPYAIRSLLFIGSIFGMIAGSWAFLYNGPGMLSPNEGQPPFHCRTLMSSGSDDEIAAVVLWLLGISALIRLSLLSKPVFLSERVLFGAISAVAVLFLFVLPDCGNLIFTAWHTMNSGLIMALALWLVSAFLLHWHQL